MALYEGDDDNLNSTQLTCPPDRIRSNARNQLASLSGATLATFAYDALGRRRSKTVGSTTNGFLYDGINLVQELAGSTPTSNLLTGLGIDETFTRADAGGTSTFLIDALGSALALADESGTVQTQYTFDPFGTTTTSGATSGNTLQFTGRENDGTGLYFNRARFYDPSHQRWLSEDPLGFAGGLNLYAYVGSDPTDRTDRLGLAGFPMSPTEGLLCAYVVGRAVGRSAKPQDSDKYLHCFASCLITKICGVGPAVAAGVGDEILDGPNPNSTFEWDDLIADWEGIKCAWQNRNCQTRCRSKYP